MIGKPVPIADMGRMMFIEDMFLHSETDIAFLNSFGMRGAFDGIDLFPPREAAFIRSMAPSRIRVLGVVDPPDGQSAVDSLIYQCEELKIDGLKLYPPGPVTTGWRMDDEKTTYPLYEVLRKHGVKNVCVHKGLPGLFLEEYCHTADLAKAAADFPDLNFIAFHCSFPFEAETRGACAEGQSKEHICGDGRPCALYVPHAGALRPDAGHGIERARRRPRALGHRYAGGGTAALADPGLSSLWVSGAARGIEGIPGNHARGKTANSRRQRRTALQHQCRGRLTCDRQGFALQAASRRQPVAPGSGSEVVERRLITQP